MSDDTQHQPTVTSDRGKSDSRADGLEGAVMVGGLIGALAASTCCLLPLVLALVGVGGAWISTLRAMAAYQPLFIAIAVAALAYGFYRVYWVARRDCVADDECARPVRTGFVKSGLWAASSLVAFVITLPYWFPIAEPYLP